MPSYTIRVKTGDKKHAGTNAHARLRLYDNNRLQTSELDLNMCFGKDFKRDQLEEFNLTDSTELSGVIHQIDLWRETKDGHSEPGWFVEYIEVEPSGAGKVFIFPFHRWIKTDQHYIIQQYDAVLPQDDPNKEQRESELVERQKMYEYGECTPGGPVRVKDIPEDEKFSDEYQALLDSNQSRLQAKGLFTMVFTCLSSWSSPESIKNLFSMEGWPWGFEKPRGMHTWPDDKYFGAQRLAGSCPVLITLCKKIPENFGVTGDMVAPFLGGLTLDDAIETKRVYIVDLKICESIKPRPDHVIPAPLCLFFVTDDKSLIPIAIQLNQEKGQENPVFLPSDDANLWTVAKIWFNNAEATYQAIMAHLAVNHLHNEGVCVCTARNLSPSHPIFKLLAPHFLYVIAINRRGLGAFADVMEVMSSIGKDGLMSWLADGTADLAMDTQADLLNDLKRREVDDAEFLPNYHYREDGLLTWNAIHKYVEKVVNIYYENDEKLQEDKEITNWTKELLAPYPNGIGMKGIKIDGAFKTRAELARFLTSVIFSSSANHAALTFAQFDQSGFLPNYPYVLEGKPPTSKEPLSDKDIMANLPAKKLTTVHAVVQRILSFRAMQSLGDFEVKYLYDPRAQEAVKELQQELLEAGKVVDERNETRTVKYDYLHPSGIPNSVSI